MTTQFRSTFRAIARVFFAVCFCVLLTISHVLPAAAAPNSSHKGTDSLPNVRNKSEQALKEEPRSRSKVQTEARKGVNEVQGGADAKRMNRPENSQQATTVEEKVRENLSNITN